MTEESRRKRKKRSRAPSLVERMRSRLEKYDSETLLLIQELLTELAEFARDQDPKRIPKILRLIFELGKKFKQSEKG